MWKQRKNQAKEHVRQDWYHTGQLGRDASDALRPVKTPFATAWTGSTPSRDAFVNGLEDSQKTVIRVWESVRDELWHTYSSEPEYIEIWIPD